MHIEFLVEEPSAEAALQNLVPKICGSGITFGIHAYRSKGGTWESMERELQRAGYFKSGLAKIKAARAISANMVPSRNRSRSFQVFQQGLLDLLR